MNGVVIRRAHLLSENQNDPYHEEGLVASIKEWVQSNDTVVLVGGGKGISTVVAAEQVGSEGFVIVYEPVMNNVETINSVVELNDVANQVEVVHAYVAVTIDTFGDPIGADHIEPAALPKCDTLILDCEGAESDILKEMRIHPSKLIVESHGIYDSPPEYIENLLEDRGYRIKDKKLAISSDERRDFCKENGIYVIVAVKDGPSPKLD